MSKTKGGKKVRQLKKLATRLRTTAARMQRGTISKAALKRNMQAMRMVERQLRGIGSINSLMKKGESTITYDAYEHTGGLAQFQLVRNLIKERVKDQQFTDIIAQNEEKWKTRLYHTIVIKGIDDAGRELPVLTMNDNNKHTIREIIAIVTSIIKKKRYTGSSAKHQIESALKKHNNQLTVRWSAPDAFTVTGATIMTRLAQ